MLTTSFAGSPSTSLSEINTRQSIVALFHSLPHLRRDLRDRLRGIDDVARVVQKFLLGRGNTDDIVAIRNSISVWSFVKSRLSLERKLYSKEGDCDSKREWGGVDALISRIEDLPELEGKIQASMDADPTRLENSLEPERAEEDTISPQELSIEDKWQQGYRWSINPEFVDSDVWQLVSTTDYRHRFSEELKALHTKFQRLMRRREDLEDDLQRHYGK